VTFDLSTENWHCTYSCPGDCLRQFRFSTFLFSSYDPIRDGRTDGRARCVVRPIGGPHYDGLLERLLDFQLIGFLLSSF